MFKSQIISSSVMCSMTVFSYIINDGSSVFYQLQNSYLGNVSGSSVS